MGRVATAAARLRTASSIFFGVPFSLRALERLLEESEGAESAGDARIDQGTRRWIDARSFRRQAVRAARETRYYAAQFERLGIDPKTFGSRASSDLPTTPKQALRDDPDAFVYRSAAPSIRGLTSGTSGRPTSVWFSRHELDVFASLAAIHARETGQVEPGDILQISISARMTVPVMINVGMCSRIGAASYLTGLVDPAAALTRLAESRTIPGKRSQTSVLVTYPSYLGALVEQAAALGYGPEAFGLRRIILGGEIATEGLKRRARALFGSIDIVEIYAMTELAPWTGQTCSDGHLHFSPYAGLLEVEGLDGLDASSPGVVGTIVGTPLAPFRDTTALLRYDTEDLVRTLPDSLTCDLRAIPGVSGVLGRREHALRHDGGWTFPRDVLEAVERVDAVPLPGRCSYRAVPGGVAVEVMARSSGSSVRDTLVESLEAHGVPVKELSIVERLTRLGHLRADLRELSFEHGEGR